MHALKNRDCLAQFGWMLCSEMRLLKSGGHRLNDPESLEVLKAAIDDIIHSSPL